jgi:hypothetical protein
VPIALLMNLARLTATALVHHSLGEAPGRLFHDVAGWMMMPLAGLLLWLELGLLRRLFVPRPPPTPPQPAVNRKCQRRWE